MSLQFLIFGTWWIALSPRIIDGTCWEPQRSAEGCIVPCETRHWSTTIPHCYMISYRYGLWQIMIIHSIIYYIYNYIYLLMSITIHIFDSDLVFQCIWIRLPRQNLGTLPTGTDLQMPDMGKWAETLELGCLVDGDVETLVTKLVLNNLDCYIYLYYCYFKIYLICWGWKIHPPE